MLRRLALVVSLVMGVASQGSAAMAKPEAAPIQIVAPLSCHEGGGADIDLTVKNTGPEDLVIEGDFHLFLARMRRSDPEVVSILFVWPAPTHQVIPAHGKVTFLLQMGVGEGGEEGIDLRGRVLRLKSEFFFEGHRQSLERHFTYPGCNQPRP